ncbi:hypothetical protein TNCV_3488001 [Trichonephila clavipes]|nr:hypothetical protein TNCV_3488001 [Trichonephila clavipes]
MGSRLVSLKTRHVGERCMLTLSGAHTSSHWCGVVVRRGGTSSCAVLVTRPWLKFSRSVTKSPRVAVKDLELEMNEDDMEELIMGHEDELTTEELQEILNEEHQETAKCVS